MKALTTLRSFMQRDPKLCLAWVDDSGMWVLHVDGQSVATAETLEELDDSLKEATA